MPLSLQMMDNNIGYQEDMSKKGKKRTWFNIDPPGKPPMMERIRLTISNCPPNRLQGLAKAKLPTWGQLRNLITEGKTGSKNRDSLNPSYLVLGYMLSCIATTVSANHTIGQCAQSSPIKTTHMGGFFCSNFHK